MPRKAHLTNHMLYMVATNTWLKNNKYVRTIGIDEVLHIEVKVSIPCSSNILGCNLYER